MKMTVVDPVSRLCLRRSSSLSVNTLSPITADRAIHPSLGASFGWGWLFVISQLSTLPVSHKREEGQSRLNGAIKRTLSGLLSG